MLPFSYILLEGTKNHVENEKGHMFQAVPSPKKKRGRLLHQLQSGGNREVTMKHAA